MFASLKRTLEILMSYGQGTDEKEVEQEDPPSVSNGLTGVSHDEVAVTKEDAKLQVFPNGLADVELVRQKRLCKFDECLHTSRKRKRVKEQQAEKKYSSSDLVNIVSSPSKQIVPVISGLDSDVGSTLQYQLEDLREKGEALDAALYEHALNLSESTAFSEAQRRYQMYHEMEESQMRIAIANSLEEVSGSSLSYKRPRSASSNLPASSAEHKRNRDMMMLEKFEEVAENSADEDDDITWV